MKKNKYKYYKIILKNILLNDAISQVVYGVFEDGKYYDLLTNKEIYMVSDINLFLKEFFLNSKCRLIGIRKEECEEEEISKFLKFITTDKKNEIIEKVEEIEKSIFNSLNDTYFNDENNQKRLKKRIFSKK